MPRSTIDAKRTRGLLRLDALYEVHVLRGLFRSDALWYPPIRLSCYWKLELLDLSFYTRSVKNNRKNSEEFSVRILSPLSKGEKAFDVKKACLTSGYLTSRYL